MSLDNELITRALPPGSMRYYAWLFTDAAQREALAALFIIDSELQDSARAAHEVAHVRLQWWRDELIRLTQAQPQHPATQSLAPHWRHTPASTWFDAWHLGAAQELAQATFETETELQSYFRASAAWASLWLHCQDHALTDSLRDAAAQLGALIREISTLRDLRIDFHHGRLYLPLADLDALNLEYTALQQVSWPASFCTWLQSRCQQVQQRWQTLDASLLATERRALRPLLILAAQHAALLTAMAAQAPLGLPTRIELSPWRRLWTAWRMARRC